MIYRRCIFLLIGVLTSGCGGWKSVSEVPEKSEYFRSQVVIGQTPRNEVHERLGEPFISEGKIEVYRVLEDPDVIVMLPTWEAREVILYALIVYDDSDVAKNIDWAIYQHDTGHEHSRSARLQASGFYFAAYNHFGRLKKRRHEILLAPPSVSRHAFETPPLPGECSVMVFLKPMEDGTLYERQLYLDGKHGVVMPLASGYWDRSSGDEWFPYHSRIFIKFLVVEGVHELKITAIHSPTEFRRKFECQGGEVFFVYPRHKVVESEPWSVWRKAFRIEGDIEIYDQPIESYVGWKRLLFYNRKWFGGD